MLPPKQLQLYFTQQLKKCTVHNAINILLKRYCSNRFSISSHDLWSFNLMEYTEYLSTWLKIQSTAKHRAQSRFKNWNYSRALNTSFIKFQIQYYCKAWRTRFVVQHRISVQIKYGAKLSLFRFNFLNSRMLRNESNALFDRVLWCWPKLHRVLKH